MKIRVLLLANGLGIGGAERSLQLYATHLDPDRFEVSVCGIFRDGERGALLRRKGIPVEVAGGDLHAVERLLRSQDPQVVHLFRSGYAEPHWNRILEWCARGPRAVVENNVFGWLDRSPADSVLDLHLHYSHSSYRRLLRQARRANYPRLERHQMLPPPVDTPAFRPPTAVERRAHRATLGISPEEPAFLHVSRTDVRRWGDLILEAFPELFRLVPDARVLLIGLPDSRRAWLMRQPFASRCRALPTTADDAVLVRIYGACDVLLHDSRKGESFGQTIAEAMACNLPVVTHATPWGHSGQLELVTHGETGFVANTPQAYAEAAAHLARNPEERLRMGRRAGEEARRRFDPSRQTEALALAYLNLLQQKRLLPVGIPPNAISPPPWPPVPQEETQRRRLEACWAASSAVTGEARVGARLRRTLWFLHDAWEALGLRRRELPP